MADGKIEIDTSINTDGIDKGVKKIDSSLKTIAKGGATFAAITTAVKTTTKVIKETTEAYKVQAKAETQLEQAAKNNPYLNKSSVAQLKNFVSQLQSISTVGDEQMLPLMAQLAAAGRTQTEIQDILSAALDVSASGMMSLDSAVTQLNATYSGNVGLLGRQISELKGLTSEELANGRAVDIIKGKFGGMAEEVAKATGSSEQLKNAFGDLKEEIGAGFEKNLSPMRKFFTELISGWTDARKAKRLYEEAKDTENKTTDQYEILIQAQNKKIDGLKTNYETAEKLVKLTDKELRKSDEFTTWLAGGNVGDVADFRAEQEKLIHDYEYEEVILQNLVNSQKDALEWEKKATEEAEKNAKAQAEAEEKKAKAAERDAKAIEFINANQKALDTQIEQIKLEAKLKGESADEQEILNAYMQSYIDLVTGSDLVTENNPYSKKRLQELQDYAKGVNTTTDEFKELKKALEEITNDGNTLEKLTNQLSELDTLAANLDKTSELYREYAEKRKQLEKEITQVQSEELEKQFSNVNNYFSQFNEITKDLTSLIRKNNEEQNNEELTTLSKQYTDGLISYEDYCNKKAQISQKAADEEYKLKMWEWTSSLLTATANIAQGVAASLAQGAPIGIVNAALVSAAGAIQLATISANKPQKFANGGYVGGASNSGDHIPVLANSGELFLNRKEQAVVSSLIGKGSGGGETVVNMPVNIQNNTNSTVNTQMDANGLTVIIDDIVKSSMSSGKYTKSMNIAHARQNGVSYY